MSASYRFACDSLVALGNATADGGVLFAKNSDRLPTECQPLEQVARRFHAPGSRVRCTYIEIPQVAETARLIGSRPFWCWGYEHGLNEHGVAIGNHTVFTKDPHGEPGLIGMDLVRLGLERSRNATQAVEVVTALIERYGQGGSGYYDIERPYHNSFLVADRATAFILESSDRHWVVRQLEDVGSVSNHLTIGSDWTALSDDAIEHAIAAGWWSEDVDERFDFAAAYRDTTAVPEVVSSGRHQRTCALLEQARGMISVDTLKRALRDHYDRDAPATDLMDPQHFSVCMHAEPVQATTASMIARIPADAGERVVYWASLGSPCVSAFVPLFVDGDIPLVLSRGGEHPDDSPWWQFKKLLEQVETDWTRYAPQVRQEFDEFEAEVAKQVRALESAATRSAARTAFMQAAVDDLLSRVRRLLAVMT